jgi:hypothetical protein
VLTMKFVMELIGNGLIVVRYVATGNTIQVKK